MPMTEARLTQLISNAERDGNTQDIPHWRELREQVRHDNRMEARRG